MQTTTLECAFRRRIDQLHESGASWLGKEAIQCLAKRYSINLGPKELVYLQNGPNKLPLPQDREYCFDDACNFFDKSYVMICAENEGYEWDYSSCDWVPLPPKNEGLDFPCD